MRDLVVLVADKNMHFALRGALGRPDAMGTRAIDHEFRTHIGRDGGVRTTGVELLLRDRCRFARALLVVDLEGSGARPDQTAEDLERVLDQELHAQWGPHAKAIVIAPEVDIWLGLRPPARGATAGNIEVVSSHIAMAEHPAVRFAVADRLAPPEAARPPFALRSIP